MTEYPQKYTVYPFLEKCPERGIAYPGNDLRNGKTGSWEKCSELCRSVSTCRVWTWTTSSKWCFVKRKKGRKLRNTNKISGSHTCGSRDNGNVFLIVHISYLKIYEIGNTNVDKTSLLLLTLH